MTIQATKPQGSIDAHHLTTKSDPVEQSIMDQISAAKEQLAALSGNREMSDKAKKAKKDELQKQINELNQQLQQHRVNKQKEQAEKQARAAQEKAEREALERTKREAEGEEDEFQPSIDPDVARGMLKADRAMIDPAEKNKLMKKLRAEARIAEAEYKRDLGGGGSVPKGKYAGVLEKQRAAGAMESELISDLVEINEEVNHTRAKQAEKAGRREDAGEDGGATPEDEMESAEAVEQSAAVENL